MNYIPIFIGLGGVLVATISVTYTTTQHYNKTNKEIRKTITRNDKKMGIIAQGMLALMQRTNGLDAERFEKAIEDNGLNSEDFINEKGV